MPLRHRLLGLATTGTNVENLEPGRNPKLNPGYCVMAGPKTATFALQKIRHWYSLNPSRAAGVCTAGFLATLAYVWHTIIQRRETTDSALVEIARLKLQNEHQKTLQAVEKTKQLQFAKEISDGERAGTKQALELLEWSLSLPVVFQATLTANGAARQDMLREIQSEDEREKEFENAKDELNEIDEDSLNKLTSRLRPMVPEIALPLRNSATRMSLGSDKPKHQRLMHLTDDIVKLVQGRKTEKEPSVIIGRIKAYDRDSGVGKVQSALLPRVLNFVVPQNRRDELRDSILVDKI